MKEEALVIFVRKPELGKVKTRLAKDIGAEAALAIYEKLLAHTHAISALIRCDKYVFYADEMEEEDRWEEGYIKQRQTNGGLGERMKAAFALLFQKGYQRICLIGSDCFELSTEIICHAFELLQDHDVVIGPAKDGGYYLLGMRDGLKEVFNEIEWSTEKVLQQTKRQIALHNYSFALLPLLRDVDTVDDLPVELLSVLQHRRSRNDKPSMF